jgi:ABC-2 type transport system permease protein/oleandomycin transport system permease protein
MSQNISIQSTNEYFAQNPPMRRFMWNITDSLVLMRRNLIHYTRVPDLLIFSTIQPIMFVLLFAYVFGGAIATPNGDYINYLMPGILVQTAVFGGTGTAIGLANDLQKGLIDRFRSLPMARGAVLAGRTLADTVRNLLVVLLMIGVGTLIGFRFQDGLLPAIGAIAIIVAFGHAMSWIFALIAIVVKDGEAAQAASFVWVFPLVFASSIFVPTSTMPDWLQGFAENQPISLITNTARAWTLGLPADDVWAAIAWIIALWIVFATLSIWRYGRAV